VEALRWYARTARLSAEYRNRTLLSDATELLGETRVWLIRRLLRRAAEAPRDPVLAVYLSEAQVWIDRLA
jgi:hypothetical protein